MNEPNILMHNFRQGSEIAFRQFMKQHIHALTFYAYRICRDKCVAEEMVADTFAKLWDRKGNFENELNIKSFLYISTRNACFDYIGSAKQRNNKLNTELNEELIYNASDPLASIIHAELIRSLFIEIEKLPRRQSEVFKMIYIEGLSTDEICTRLNISANAVFIAKKKATDCIKSIFAKEELILLLALTNLLLEKQ